MVILEPHANRDATRVFHRVFHIEQLKPELNKQVGHVSLPLHFKIYLLLFTGSN